MSPNPSPTPRAMPWGLVGMLVLSLGVEVFVSKNPTDFLSSECWDWRMSWKSAGSKASKADVLIFGDSLAKISVVPSVVEARTGHSAYNQAVFVGQAPGSFFLFRKALDAGARPKAVILETHPHLLVTGPDDNIDRWPEATTWRDAVELAWTARDASVLTAIALGKVWPTYHDRSILRANIRAALLGDYAGARYTVAPMWRNQRLNQGAQPAGKNPEFRGKLEEIDPTVFPNYWIPHPVNLTYLDRFLTLAESKGIPVIWLVPPISPPAYERRHNLGLNDAFTRMIESLRQRHSVLRIVDGRSSDYPTKVFGDPMHLDRDGAATLSTDVADVVAALLQNRLAPGWHTLPKYRRTEGPFEDYKQSMIAVQEIERTKRR